MTANRIAVVHRAVVLFSLAGGIAFAQSSSIPATNLAADAPHAVAPAYVPRLSPYMAHHAQVVYSNGQIEITANDSSLSQILHDLGLLAKIKITGTVPDQPVFGKYGPASPAKILASLLEGTGSNMLLTSATPDGPAELILTSRQGGPTPSDPTASITSAQLTSQPAQPRGYTSPPPAQQGAAQGTTPGQSTQSTGASDPPVAPPVTTPQQIWERVQQLRAMQHPQ